MLIHSYYFSILLTIMNTIFAGFLISSCFSSPKMATSFGIMILIVFPHISAFLISSKKNLIFLTFLFPQFLRYLPLDENDIKDFPIEWNILVWISYLIFFLYLEVLKIIRN